MVTTPMPTTTAGVRFSRKASAASTRPTASAKCGRHGEGRPSRSRRSSWCSTTGAGPVTGSTGVRVVIRTVCTNVSVYGVPTAQASRTVSRSSARASIRALTASKPATGGAAYGEKASSTCATPATTSPSTSTPR